jgi:hypothetical protein
MKISTLKGLLTDGPSTLAVRDVAEGLNAITDNAPYWSAEKLAAHAQGLAAKIDMERIAAGERAISLIATFYERLQDGRRGSDSGWQAEWMDEAWDALEGTEEQRELVPYD